jgi:endoglucanase
VEFGKQYGVHVSLNFHRAPGFSVDRSIEEPFNLWADEEAQQAFDYHWAHFAERYKGIPNRYVSFNLVNEPATYTTERIKPVPEEVYAKVARRVTRAIRNVDPNRLIITDGLWWARDPIPSLADLDIVQSTRGYEPMQITHYNASWVHGAQTWPTPAWPLNQVREAELRWAHKEMHEVYMKKLERWGVPFEMQWNKERLKLQLIDPWLKLQEKGVSVHVGEFGAFSQTPHKAVLGWMRDLLSLWKNAGWGWAMWNFRGGFGILDSNREDVRYENYKGHKFDRQMLELLKEF